jgi:DNA primase
VSFATANDAKERIRQAIDIVDLLRDYLGDVQREGRNYKALCPWHDDSRPSLKINPERQTYKCWVCDIGGDIFSFVMQYEGVTFPEALRTLADKAGIQLEPAGSGASGRSKAQREQKVGLYEVMAWAERKYHDCLLRLPEGEPARKYLKSRGISQDSVVRFHLGAAPDSWTWIQGHARKENIDLRLLVEAGVVARRESGGTYYDRFKGRLLFSIRDPQGRPVGLGGRVLPEFAAGEQAKYVNSPETPLFTKHKLLYGMDQAREAIRSGASGSRTVLVMEGYTDCIVAHQLGIKNAVAVLGTALGETHIKELSRLADQIVLVLDGDDAGRRRANEVLELFVAQQVDLRILTLPDNLDPCDFLLERGAEAFKALLAGAVDALEHKFQLVSQRLGLSRGTHEAHTALEDVLGTLAKAPRLDERTSDAAALRTARMLSRLAHLSGVDEATLRKRLAELRRTARRRMSLREAKETFAVPPRADTASDPVLERWERHLLESLLLAPDMLDQVRATLSPEQFASPQCRAIYETACRLADSGRAATVEWLLLELDDPQLKNRLVELDEAGQKRSCDKQLEDTKQEVHEILKRFRQLHTEQQQIRDTALLREGHVEDNRSAQIVNQIIEQQRARQGLS